ncbi:LOXH1 protein, partial [Aphelocoma coerulescens]|nr:LOXH1 protein [Aphelocoma coerulescens]
MVMVFYGSNSKSNPVSMENKVEHQTENQITYDIHLPSDLGVLYKVRLGLQSLENNISQLSLRHFKIQNTSTLDTFSLTLNKTLPLSPNGDRWIEFPIQWPLKEALSVISRNILNERNIVHITACIYGTHGDTGDRSLLQLSQNVQQGEKNKSFLVIVDAVDLGQLEKIVLLVISKTDCKLEVKKLHVQEAAKEHPTYVFEVNEEFSVSANKPEIQREIQGSFVIRGEKQMNDIDNNLNKERSQVKNLTEYTIKVSTGDKRGAGTDTNVHILFGNEDKSEVFQLSQSLKHQNPFGRGKVDTFKIKTKKLGRLCSIEIGHNGKGL